MEKEKINDIIKILDNRPFPLDTTAIYITEEERKVYYKNIEDLHTISDNLINPLKIVLMGEVKAGKSTLLNAIAGAELSNMGVTETTAVITEVSYSLEKEAIIYYKNSEAKIYNIEDLYLLFEAKHNDEDFFAEIEKVKMSFPISVLKDIHLVDTPGVETVTSANQKTTIDYIQQSDVVLWVLSVHHLGQTSIEERIMEIADYGKPIILAVNRLDQVNEEPETIIDYVEDTYGLFVEKVFGLSAMKALEGKVNKNSALLVDSGLSELLHYLETNIERSADDVKKASISSSVLSVVQKEIITSVKILEQMRYIYNTIQKRQEDREYFKNKINNDIEIRVRNFIQFEFLDTEEKYLLSSDLSQGEISKQMKNYLSPPYLKAHIESFWKKLQNDISEEQKFALRTMGDKMIEEERDINEHISSYLSFSEVDTSVLNENALAITKNTKENTKKGFMLGGSYGIAAAAYTAVLGPYAAAVGLGTALVSILPPVLLIGAASGAIYSLFNKGKNKQSKEDEIEEYFSKIRNQAKKSMEKPVQKMHTSNSTFFDNRYKELVNHLMGNQTLSDVENDIDKTKEYVSCLEKKLLELKEIDVNIDTLHRVNDTN